MTMVRIMSAVALVIAAGCATGEDFVPPPPKPLTDIHTEPQMPASESNARPVATETTETVVDKTPKRRAKARDEKHPLPPTAVRKVALVVQNHAAPGVEIPFMALTDALTAKLSGCGLQVINPYNTIGVNLNRTAAGEKMPEVSAMEIARKLKADGAITASVLEFFDSASDSSHQYSIRIVLNIADAWSGATVVEGEKIEKSSPYYVNDLVGRKKLKLLNDLMYSAADECAAKLKKNPNLLRWEPTPPPPPKPLPPPPKALPDKLTIKVLDEAIDKLFDEMLAHRRFRDEYANVKAATNRAPLVVVRRMEDKTIGKGGIENPSNLFDSASARVRIKLYDAAPTFSFKLKSDEDAVRVAQRIISGRNGGWENDEGLKKDYVGVQSPDFYLISDLSCLEANRFRLRMAIYALKSQEVFWEGTHDIELAKR